MRTAYLWFALYVATIPLANWTLATFGLVPVWPGVLAPAGVLWAGLALTLRDLVQETAGRWAVLLAILAGALLSALVSPQFALASALAFLVSELCDFGVYTPLRRHHWLGAVLLSNTVGLLVDSVLFLSLAFGSLDFLTGQVVGKVEVTLLTVAALWCWRRQRRGVLA